jgi:hypothetical protein
MHKCYQFIYIVITIYNYYKYIDIRVLKRESEIILRLETPGSKNEKRGRAAGFETILSDDVFLADRMLL